MHGVRDATNTSFPSGVSGFPYKHKAPPYMSQWLLVIGIICVQYMVLLANCFQCGLLLYCSQPITDNHFDTELSS